MQTCGSCKSAGQQYIFFFQQNVVIGLLPGSNKPVFMSFSDTESVFLDVALLLEILQGSPFSLNDYLGKHRALITSHLVIS